MRMRKNKKLYVFALLGCLLFTGCQKEPEADTASMSSELDNEISETVFWWGAEEYFHLLEGEWIAVEYAGLIRDSHFDEATEEGYQEKMQEYTDEVIEKYLGSEYCIEIDNLEYFGPCTDLCFIMEDDDELFNITRFIPGEFITITPPYIGLSVQLTDKDESYQFIIDADGTVLIEIEYHFFRLEKKSDREDTEEADSLVQDTEHEEKSNLDGWIGEYTFSEYYEHGDLAPQFWGYDIDIYKENGQYYADVAVDGHMIGFHAKAQVYGDEEWISLVLMEYKPDHVMGLSEMENNVILSLRKEEENLYTYWGILTPLWEAEGGVSESGGSYLQRTEESDSTEENETADDMAQNMSGEDVTDIADLSGWVGEYAYSEGSGKGEMDYDLIIYEENGQYYGDVVMNGNDNTIDVKVRVYGDEEWISLVLAGYNPGHVSGLEGMENSVLFSLRKQGKDIYTYWGEEDVVINLIEGDTVHYDTVYYKSNQYFEKAEN